MSAMNFVYIRLRGSQYGPCLHLNAAMAKLRGTSKENEIAPDDDLGEGAIDLDE